MNAFLPGVHEAQWDLPPDPEAIGKAREMTRDLLQSWALGDLVDEVLIIIDELCTNAIRHGRAPISMSLRAAGRCVGGEVADAGAPFVPSPRLPGDHEEGGRGLVLVAAFADRWGVKPAPDGGKVVWFSLAREPSPDGPACPLPQAGLLAPPPPTPTPGGGATTQTLTQAQAAQDIGVSLTTIHSWLARGQLTLDPAHVADVAVILSNKYLNQRQAASVLGVDPKTLGNMLAPDAYTPAGRPRYLADQVEALRERQAAAGELLTPARAARILGVTPDFVARLADAYGLPVARTPGGHRRYLRDAVEACHARRQARRAERQARR